jgi:histidinol-phosphate aminotransferase
LSKYWSNTARGIEPYVPGEQPRDRKYIKLNTNENPYPPSPRVIKAIRDAANDSLRLYPDPTCDDLRRALAEHYGLDKEQVYVGNGSDELLAFSFLAFFNPGEPILFPDITYSFYPVYSNLFNIDYINIPLNEEFGIDIEKFFQKNGGIIIPNPNAPTAKCLPLESVRKVLDKNLEKVVIIDEAYIDFGGETSTGLINEYPNLLVIQTLSKSRSLAGLRVGFAFGHKGLIEGIDRIKNSFNSYTVDRLAIAATLASIEDEDYFNYTREKIIRTRERVIQQLGNIGFKVVESKANFIFISHPSFPAEDIFKRLRENGILVRYFKRPRIDNFLRVTIGTDEEMDEFLKIVREITCMG